MSEKIAEVKLDPEAIQGKKFNDRVEVEITEDFGYLKKGDIHSIHPVEAERFVKLGKAKRL